MKCYNPLTIYKNLDRNKFKYGIEVGCGKCINCKANRALEKAIRMLHEKDTYKEKEGKYKAHMLTFTYTDREIKRRNGKPTLSKEWVRKIRDKIYSRMYRKYYKSGKEKKNYINYKYMIAGEYGENGTQRPHYHMIILTRGYHSKIVHEWIKEMSGGRTEYEEVISDAGVMYVAGYVSKKIGKDSVDDDIEDPFLICSKGLGKEWALRHSEELKQRGYIHVPKKRGVMKHSIPRIYIDWLEKEGLWTEEEVEEYKKEKQEYAQNERDKKIKEVIGEEHFKITGRIFEIEEDVVKKTDRMFETYDEYTNYYYNYTEKTTGLWRNSLWEHYNIGINRIRKIKAEKNLEEYKAKRDNKYVERERNCKLS